MRARFEVHRASPVEERALFASFGLEDAGT